MWSKPDITQGHEPQSRNGYSNSHSFSWGGLGKVVGAEMQVQHSLDGGGGCEGRAVVV